MFIKCLWQPLCGALLASAWWAWAVFDGEVADGRPLLWLFIVACAASAVLAVAFLCIAICDLLPDSKEEEPDPSSQETPTP